MARGRYEYSKHIKIIGVRYEIVDMRLISIPSICNVVLKSVFSKLKFQKNE